MNTIEILTGPFTGACKYVSLTTFFLVYILAVRKLRHRRCQEIQKPFNGSSGRPLSSMTAKEAHAIMIQLQELEFPYNLHNALSFGLLKTAGIPTISKLLIATRQLSLENASKRAADTEVLLAEAQYSDPASERYMQAIARMNYLHDRYRKAGKILDKDMLHTLSSGVVEIFKFVDKYEWRELSDVERCAIGVFHKGLGEAMEIPFTPLPSHEQGWTDGLHFALELRDWCYAYEKSVAGPTRSNTLLAQRIADIAAAGAPWPLKGIKKKVIAATLDEHMRISMGFEEPNYIVVQILHRIRTIRRFILRHLSLPRPSFFAVKIISDGPNPMTGLFNINKYAVDPWYVKPTFLQRYGLKAWITWFFATGGSVNARDIFQSQGYDIRKIGPAAQYGKGMPEMAANVEKLNSQDRTGCPFSLGK